MSNRIVDIARDLQDLNPDSLVIDVGGYDGKFSAVIAECFDPRIIIFEPWTTLYQKCHKRFQDNPKITVYKKACAMVAEKRELYGGGDATSFFPDHAKGEGQETVSAIPLSRLVNAVRIGEQRDVDLIKINCEGGEFEILPDLYRTGEIQHVKQILIQWHNLHESSDKLVNMAHAKLAKTHDLVMDKGQYIWELWRKK